MKLVRKLSPISKEPIYLQCARNELGVKELSGKANAKRVLEYHQATTLKASSDDIAWCSSFVCWCLETTGIKSTRSAAARSYLSWGKRINEPTVGCIVVFQRGNSSWQGHVGFVVGWDKTSITVLGGNQRDSVCIQKYPRSKVLGFRVPA
jgi:uncharacterized protein (TIGR02594 family)